MHVITDENGNVIQHGHSHDHGEAAHCHDTACGSCGGCADPEKETVALVSYMVDHNKHHAAELADVAKKFRETGKEDVAVQIEKAIENFDKGNLYLSLALSLVK